MAARGGLTAKPIETHASSIAKWNSQKTMHVATNRVQADQSIENIGTDRQKKMEWINRDNEQKQKMHITSNGVLTAETIPNPMHIASSMKTNQNKMSKELMVAWLLNQSKTNAQTFQNTKNTDNKPHIQQRFAYKNKTTNAHSSKNTEVTTTAGAEDREDISPCVDKHRSLTRPHSFASSARSRARREHVRKPKPISQLGVKRVDYSPQSL